MISPAVCADAPKVEKSETKEMHRADPTPGVSDKVGILRMDDIFISCDSVCLKFWFLSGESGENLDG